MFILGLEPGHLKAFDLLLFVYQNLIAACCCRGLSCLVLFLVLSCLVLAFSGACRSRPTLYRAEHHTPVGRVLRSCALNLSSATKMTPADGGKAAVVQVHCLYSRCRCRCCHHLLTILFPALARAAAVAAAMLSWARRPREAARGLLQGYEGWRWRTRRRGWEEWCRRRGRRLGWESPVWMPASTGSGLFFKSCFL